MLLEESSRCDSASSLCRARSFLRLAASSKSSFAVAVTRNTLDAGEVIGLSVGGFALYSTINHYHSVRI